MTDPTQDLIDRATRAARAVWPGRLRGDALDEAVVERVVRAVLEAAWRAEPSVRCGDEAPLLAGFDTPRQFCVLPYAHADWHRSDAGTQWIGQLVRQAPGEVAAGPGREALPELTMDNGSEWFEAACGLHGTCRCPATTDCLQEQCPLCNVLPEDWPCPTVAHDGYARPRWDADNDEWVFEVAPADPVEPETCGEPCGTFPDDCMALCVGPPGHLEGPDNRWHSPWEHDFAAPGAVPDVPLDAAALELVQDFAEYFAAGERAVENGGPPPPWDGLRFRRLRSRARALVGQTTEEGRDENR